jgi:hypothetical protein
MLRNTSGLASDQPLSAVEIESLLRWFRYARTGYLPRRPDVAARVGGYLRTGSKDASGQAALRPLGAIRRELIELVSLPAALTREEQRLLRRYFGLDRYPEPYARRRASGPYARAQLVGTVAQRRTLPAARMASLRSVKAYVQRALATLAPQVPPRLAATAPPTAACR